MAFDRSTRYSAADAAVDVNAELGRAYVEPGSENVDLAVLDPRRAAILNAWAETLIPGDGTWPAATAVPVVGYVDRTLELARKLRPRVFEALDEAAFHSRNVLGEDFETVSPTDRVAVLRVVEERAPLLFTLLKELTYEIYYRDPRVAAVVRERTGFHERNPIDGVELPEFDEALLADVVGWPSIVREAP
jgi:hypothetical protein